MADSEFDLILRGTLKDYRVSRGERRVLRQVLKELNADEQKLDYLRHRAFAIAREETISPTAHGVLEWLEDIVKVLDHDDLGDGAQKKSSGTGTRAWFSPGDDCLRAIQSLLRDTRREVAICVFTITDDRISDAIIECHRRGMKVRILTDDDKSEDRGSDIDRLERAGIAVRVDQSPYHMHHKFALFDNKKLLTGSYNWTRSAAKYNEENLIVSRETGLVKQFADQFDQLWKNMN